MLKILLLPDVTSALANNKGLRLFSSDAFTFASFSNSILTHVICPPFTASCNGVRPPTGTGSYKIKDTNIIELLIGSN